MDVAVISPSAGVVHVYPLMADGLPGSEVIAQVAALLLADKVRPLTDLVKVLPPVVRNYAVHVAVTVQGGHDAATVKDAAQAALETYVAKPRGPARPDIVPHRSSRRPPGPACMTCRSYRRACLCLMPRSGRTAPA